MTVSKFEYHNTQEEVLLPEYGRNIQKLIQHAKTLTDQRERQAAADAIVNMMNILVPTNRNFEDHREKLWKHLFKISNYELEVTTPTGKVYTPEDEKLRPDKIPYPKVNTKFRHYGYGVQLLIKKAAEMEEGAVRDGFTETIGAYMKLAYRTWNKEHYVSDDVIKDDLNALSGGKLKLEDVSQLDNLAAGADRKDRVRERERERDRQRYRRGGRGGGGAGGGRSNNGGGGGGDKRHRRR